MHSSWLYDSVDRWATRHYWYYIKECRNHRTVRRKGIFIPLVISISCVGQRIPSTGQREHEIPSFFHCLFLLIAIVPSPHHESVYLSPTHRKSYFCHSMFSWGVFYQNRYSSSSFDIHHLSVFYDPFKGPFKVVHVLLLLQSLRKKIDLLFFLFILFNPPLTPKLNYDISTTS